MRPVVLALFAAAGLAAQVTSEKEAALGAHVASEYRKGSQILNAPVAQAYVDSLGRCLAASMPRAPFAFTFGLITNNTGPTHEPVWLPAGYIFVPAALFTATENEAEFAGMLAHAMTHTANRHYAQPSTSTTQPPVTVLFTGIGDESNSLVPMSLLSVSREYESIADANAAEAMAGAGFDPKALRSYLSRTAPETETPNSRYPARDLRTSALDRLIPRLTVEARTCNLDFDSAREEVRKLTLRPAPSLIKPAAQ